MPRKRRKRKRKLTARKAGKMLKHGRARGKKLTKRQKRFFGWVRGGRKKPRRRRRRRR